MRQLIYSIITFLNLSIYLVHNNDHISAKSLMVMVHNSLSSEVAYAFNSELKWQELKDHIDEESRRYNGIYMKEFDYMRRLIASLTPEQWD